LNISSARRGQPQPVSIALYLACLVVQISGLAAVAFQLLEPRFTQFTLGLTLIGTLTSFTMRRLGIGVRTVKFWSLLLLFIFFCAIRRVGIFGSILPLESGITPDMVLVSALAFTATFGSFFLVSDDTVVFSCVWTIAMIGLTGTVNVNRELPICFICFLAGASFVLVHQNALKFGGEDSAGEHPSGSLRLLRTHLLTALAACGTALLLGGLVAIPVQMVGRNMSLATIIQRLRVPLDLPRHVGTQLTFDELRQFNVGLGPVQDDPAERLSVVTIGPHYWRGRTYDRYTGHGWESASIGLTQGMPPVGVTDAATQWNTFKLPLRVDFGHNPTHSLIADFHSGSGLFGPVYHAAEPVVVRAALPLVYAHSDGTVGGRSDGADFQVQSTVVDVKAGQLRRSVTNYPAEISDRYLPLPPMDGTVQRMVDDVLRDLPNNPYDRALALKRFVAQRCTYSHLARAVPRDSDAAEFFLNDSREGYCDLYASAMTVMCRMAGIPARVATGFAPGTPVADAALGSISGDRRTHYVLRGNDLHAWCEVYFSGFGWQVFDATEDTNGPVPPVTTPLKAQSPEVWSLLQRRRVATLLFGTAILVLIGIGVNELRMRRGTPMGRSASGGVTDAAALEVAGIYARALRLLRRRGAAREIAATPAAYVEAVRRRFGDPVARELRTLTDLLERGVYGGNAAHLTTADLAVARATVPALRAALKRAGKDQA
jgi:hypothetical protein